MAVGLCLMTERDGGEGTRKRELGSGLCLEATDNDPRPLSKEPTSRQRSMGV